MVPVSLFATPVSAPVGRKRASTSTPLVDSQGSKKPKNGADAISGLGLSVDRMADVVAAAYPPPMASAAGLQPSPVRRMSAIDKVQREEHWLTADQRVNLMDVLDSTRLSDTYLRLNNSPDRRAWVSKRLNLGTNWDNLE